jgi:hypothetical protein
VNARWLLPGSLEGTGWYSHRLLERLCSTPNWEVHLFMDRRVDGVPSAGKGREAGLCGELVGRGHHGSWRAHRGDAG